MNKIKIKKAIYNADKTECLEIGGINFNEIEPFLKTCKKVPDKLPEHITSLFESFYGNKSATITGIEKGDTSNVTDMNIMFSGCENLVKLDLSNFNITNVIYMHTMFYNCKSLTTLDLSNGDTTNVVNMRYMFYNCENLKTLNMFYFDNKNIDYMFYGCTKLEKYKYKRKREKNMKELQIGVDRINKHTNEKEVLIKITNEMFSNYDRPYKLLIQSKKSETTRFYTSGPDNMTEHFKTLAELRAAIRALELLLFGREIK